MQTPSTARHRRELLVLKALLDSGKQLDYRESNWRVRKALQDSNYCQRAARALLEAQLAALQPAPVGDQMNFGREYARSSGREDSRFDPRCCRLSSAQITAADTVRKILAPAGLADGLISSVSTNRLQNVRPDLFRHAVLGPRLTEYCGAGFFSEWKGPQRETGRVKLLSELTSELAFAEFFHSSATSILLQDHLSPVLLVLVHGPLLPNIHLIRDSRVAPFNMIQDCLASTLLTNPYSTAAGLDRMICLGNDMRHVLSGALFGLAHLQDFKWQLNGPLRVGWRRAPPRNFCVGSLMEFGQAKQTSWRGFDSHIDRVKARRILFHTAQSFSGMLSDIRTVLARAGNAMESDCRSAALELSDESTERAREEQAVAPAPAQERARTSAAARWGHTGRVPTAVRDEPPCWLATDLRRAESYNPDALSYMHPRARQTTASASPRPRTLPSTSASANGSASAIAIDSSDESLIGEDGLPWTAPASSPPIAPLAAAPAAVREAVARDASGRPLVSVSWRKRKIA